MTFNEKSLAARLTIIGLLCLIVGILWAAHVMNKEDPAEARHEESRIATAVLVPKKASHVGDTVLIGGKLPWICGSTKAAHSEALKWSGLHDRAEMIRTLARTRSTLLTPGVWVEVVDSGIYIRKVRVIGNDKLTALLPTSKECWVESEALEQ